jgi:hypothetical protein
MAELQAAEDELMLTDQQAIDAAFAFIIETGIVDKGVRLAAKPRWVKRVPGAVVVGYNSVEFVETDDSRVGLVGNMPIRVEEATGACRELSMDEYFELYEDDDEPDRSE